MELQLGKTYLCANGSEVKITKLRRTISGQPDRAMGVVGPSGCLTAQQIEYDMDGRPITYGMGGYRIVREIAPYGELMFSFPMDGPEHSTTVSESGLKELIADVRSNNFAYRAPAILAAAAERMIEVTKTNADLYSQIGELKRAPPKLNPSQSIRVQLARMIEEIGLEPTRFLNNPEKDIKPMCQPEPTSKEIADQAARRLAKLMSEDLGVNVPPILLRLWLVERWDEVSKLAHKIHGTG